MTRLFTKNCPIHGETWHTDAGCNECRNEAEAAKIKEWQTLDLNGKLDFLFSKATGIEIPTPVACPECEADLPEYGNLNGDDNETS